MFRKRERFSWFSLGGLLWFGISNSLRAENSNGLSTALIVAQVLAFLWMLAVGLLALLLMVVADTGRGRLFACTSLLTAILPFAICFAIRRCTKQWKVSVICGGVAWLGFVMFVLALTPTGLPQPARRVMHGFAEKGAGFPRYSLANLLPEGDQLRLGFTLMPLIDPLLTTTQAAKLKRLTASIYDELERDLDFRELGSAMSGAYGELLGQTWVSGHSYVYVPQAADVSRPMPVLVFFHGSGGNFKAYLWILSKVADRLGFALVAPSNGLGNWTEDDSTKGLTNALAAASRLVKIDLGRIHIIGLSNGGLAISRLAESQGSHFASMTFLSPVFATPSIRSSSFATQCAHRRVLVITGSMDDRVPLDYVEENADWMKRGGAQVTLKAFGGADHFLFFSHRDDIIKILERWLRGDV